MISQAAGETIADYEAALRNLAKNFAEFEDYLEKALRDRFVCGIRNESIRRRLLTEKALTLTKAVEQALSMEAAERNAQSFSGTESSIKRLQIRSKQRTSQFACTRCGKTNHAAKDCKFKDDMHLPCMWEKGPVSRSQDPHPQRTNRVVQ